MPYQRPNRRRRDAPDAGNNAPKTLAIVFENCPQLLTILSRVCGLVSVLLSVNASGQPVGETFQTHSGKSIGVKMEDLPGEPTRIIFSVGEHTQILDIGLPPTDHLSREALDEFPVRSRVISLPSLKEPLILALASQAGASDCLYGVTPISVQDGKMPRFFTSGEVAFSNEGGLAIWASGRKTNMVVWNPIWAGREGHYDAHRYVYYWYSWNPSRHKFQYTRSTESSKRLNSAEESLNLSARSAVEISYRTRADWFPEAAEGC
jgi:hypothetical protein